MKKFMLAAIAIVAMCSFVAPANAEKMMFGVKGGLNMANLTGDGVDLLKEDFGELSMKLGMVGGVFMSYDLTEIFAIQPELLYTMKGAKFSDITPEVSFKINYLEIPVLFKATLPTEGNLKPSLYAGPAFGFLLSSKIGTEDIDVDMKDVTKSFDIGIVAGAALGYKLSSGMMFGEFRYEVGMATIDDPDEGDEIDLKNSAMSFMVGYGFAF